MVLGPRGGEAAIVFSPLVVEVSCCGFSLPTNNSVVLHFLALDSSAENHITSNLIRLYLRRENRVLEIGQGNRSPRSLQGAGGAGLRISSALSLREGPASGLKGGSQEGA